MRTIVERLARRCGYDAVAAAMPAGDKRLLQHIRREALRKQRLRAGGGSQVSEARLTGVGRDHAALSRVCELQGIKGRFCMAQRASCWLS